MKKQDSNYIDLSKCNKMKSKIDWNNSIGAIVPFLFNGVESYFKIIGYNKKSHNVKIE